MAFSSILEQRQRASKLLIFCVPLERGKEGGSNERLASPFRIRHRTLLQADDGIS